MRSGFRRRGFSLLELLAALAVGTLMVVGLMALVDDSLEDTQGHQAALHQSRVVQAAHKYIDANYGALVAAATAGTPAVVDVATLKTAQLLPAGFNATNAYGQTPCVLVLQPAAGKLDALVVTEGGSAIETKMLAYVAANAGEGGGFIGDATPATAKGAFGSWSVPLAPYVSRSCSGTAATTGRLASGLFFDSPGNISSDFVYRAAVPGHPELNRMVTPLHMAAVVVDDTSDALCAVADPTSSGRIAVNATGRILTCQSGVWKPTGSAFWKDPVANFAALPAAGNTVGDVRLVLDIGRAFSWNGVGWVALAVDENGNLVVPGKVEANHLQVNAVEVVNTPCSPNGLIARDNQGLILSCQLGKWSSQSNSELAYTENGNVIILKSDFITYPPGTVFYTGSYRYDVAADWMYAEVVRDIMPVKDGLVIVNVSVAMDRELITDPTVRGQTEIFVQIVNKDNNQVVGLTRAMSPIVTNDTVIVSATISKAVPKNTNGYSVRLDTGWSVYGGSPAAAIYHRSNYKDALNQTVEKTPVQTTWTLDLTY